MQLCLYMCTRVCDCGEQPQRAVPLIFLFIPQTISAAQILFTRTGSKTERGALTMQEPINLLLLEQINYRVH